MQASAVHAAIVAVLSMLGIPRAFATFQGEPNLSREEQEMDASTRHMRRFPLLPSRAWAARAEWLATAQDFAETVVTRLPGNIPLTLIEARKQQTASSASWFFRILLPRGYDLEAAYRRLYEAAWAEHQLLVSSSTRGRLIRVPQSGHIVQAEAPDVVIAAIRDTILDLRD
jgi:hypothetical protein